MPSDVYWLYQLYVFLYVYLEILLIIIGLKKAVRIIIVNISIVPSWQP